MMTEPQTKRQRGGAAEELTAARMDSTRFVTLLRKLIGEAEHLQNSPAQGLYPKEVTPSRGRVLAGCCRVCFLALTRCAWTVPHPRLSCSACSALTLLLSTLSGPRRCACA